MSNEDNENTPRYVEMDYDIPGRPPICANPSSELRHYAVRRSQSVWVMREERLDRSLVERMEREGCTVNVLRYDVGERQQVMAFAKCALAREIRRIRTSLDASIKEARKRLDDAQRLTSANDVKKGIAYYQAALNRARREVDAAEEAALAFDMIGQIRELTDALRDVVASYTTTYLAQRIAAEQAVAGQQVLRAAGA